MRKRGTEGANRDVEAVLGEAEYEWKTMRKTWREERREEGKMLVVDKVSCFSRLTAYLRLPSSGMTYELLYETIW